MGYTLLRHREGSSSSSEFKRALMKAKEAIEMLCELSEDMEEQYGERYGERGRYYRRDDDMWERRRY